MDKAILIPSASLGLILIAIYTFRCWKNNRKFSNSVMANAIIQASGIVCGLFLTASVFFEKFKAIINEIDLYILIGGLMVLAISARAAYKDIISATSVELSNSKKGKYQELSHTANIEIKKEN